ncbi:glucose dehydrogenase [FAD, quinone]-like [Thrips palmi]|uniref:Glucose dehydrogenase [FAD, quinone]-like n=1 Tax=Thrips palmi TaxID=161013 RepID=A0A6P8ZJA2_THRPL|nr:glucose dehydrogenase [FAD, quinone]-like [Thrips palmi]
MNLVGYDFHSTGGPQAVSWPPYRHPAIPRFAAAFAEAGVPPRLDINARGQLGHSVIQTTAAGGERWSTYRGYLQPALGRPNLRAITYATVTEVLFHHDQGLPPKPRASGVKFRDAAGQVRVVRARREVVLTAGALHTPQILILSGIGPAQDLQALNIPVVSDLPVGRGLQDHPGPSGMAFDCTPPLCHVDWEHRRQDLQDYGRHRGGPLSSASLLQLTAFLRTTPEPPRGPRPAEQPDLQIVLDGTVVSDDGTVCLDSDEWRMNRISMQSVALHPRSRGSVHINSSDPLGPPLVRLGYFTDDADHDLSVVVAGLRLALRMEGPLRKRGLALSRDPRLAPACTHLAFGSDEHLRCLARTTTYTTWHFVGTCRMGAVVDTRLLVRGVRGLRVADASVIPTLTSGNTNAPTIMVAERAADFIKQDHRELYRASA